MKNKVFIITGRLKLSGGGVTHVIVNRANSFADSGIDSSILTLSDPYESEADETSFRSSNRLNENVSWINIYNDLEQRSTVKHARDGIKQRIKYALNKIELLDKRFMGHVTKKRDYFSNGSLRGVDYYKDNGVLFKKKTYDTNGCVRSISYISNKGERTKIYRYTSAGSLYLITNLNKDAKYKHKLYTIKNREPLRFKSTKKLRIYWLELLSADLPDKPFIICDRKSLYPTLMSVKGVSHNIYTIHSNHFNRPYIPGSGVKENRLYFFERIPEIDCIVTLTERQKKHIVDEFGDYSNIYVIPNQFRKPLINTANKKKGHFSMVARLSKQKRIVDAIEAFAEVKNKSPNVTLSIYGDGDYREELELLIKNKGLTDNITLHGQTSPKGIDVGLAESQACLLTSTFEGLPLVILEAAANKTPMVSYDINYGPSDVILNNKTGIVLKTNTVNELAKNILFLIDNPDVAHKMGQNAKKFVYNNFSDKKIVSQWVELFNKFNK